MTPTTASFADLLDPLSPNPASSPAPTASSTTTASAINCSRGRSASHAGIQPGPMATFPRWKELGRHVRKGEKAITLCQPVTVKRTHAADDGTDEPRRLHAVRLPAALVRAGADRRRRLPAARSQRGTLPGPGGPRRHRGPLRRDRRQLSWGSRASARSPYQPGQSACRTKRGSTNWRMCCSAIPPKATSRWRADAAQSARV